MNFYEGARWILKRWPSSAELPLRLFGAFPRGGGRITQYAHWRRSGLLRVIKEDNSLLADSERARGAVHLRSSPVILQMEITNRCNLRCRTCARNYWDDNLNPLGDMQIETVRRLDRILARASTVVLFGYGESLLSPNFFRIFSHVATFEPHTSLFTNGSTLSLRNIEKLIELRLSQLTVSLDGATESQVSRTRSGLSLSTVIDNVMKVNREKDRVGTELPSLSFSFTASVKTIDELPELVRLADSLNVRQIGVGFARIFDPAQEQESVFSDTQRVIERIEESKRLGEELSVEVSWPNILSEGCDQPFKLLFVKWNGDVSACCASAFYSEPPLQIRLGNIWNDKFQDLWNGPYIRSVRAGLLGGGALDPVCRTCPFFKLNYDNLIRLT